MQKKFEKKNLKKFKKKSKKKKLKKKERIKKRKSEKKWKNAKSASLIFICANIFSDPKQCKKYAKHLYAISDGPDATSRGPRPRGTISGV